MTDNIDYDELARQSAIALYLEDASRSAAEVARMVGWKQQTVWNWLNRAGVLRKPRKQQIANEAVAMYLDGKTYQEVANHFEVARAMICAIVAEHGVTGQGGREARKSSSRIKAREMYAEGKTYAEVARALKISAMTVARWTEDIEGGAEITAQKDRNTAIKAYGEGATIEAIATTLGRSVNTISGWLHETGVEIRSSVERMTAEQRAEYSAKGVAARLAKKAPPEKRLCEYCGQEFTLPEGRRKSRQVYCSQKCAGLGRRDPERRRTFACEVCGKEVERFASMNGRGRYCSRECYFKRNITVDKFVDWEGNILDSSWEALFLGLCGFLKVPVERFDRENGVEWRPGQWYAPDFWLPFDAMAVEIKGQPDEHDEERWAAFRETRALIVVDREMMDRLRMACNRQEFELVLF